MSYEIEEVPTYYICGDAQELRTDFHILHDGNDICTMRGDNAKHNAAVFIAAKQKEEAAIKVVNEYEETA